ncbi:MAG: collagen-like protein [Oscillospiraceae bacterium]|nr:collagen-like protein [Oscillospiraceae bacterium]
MKKVCALMIAVIFFAVGAVSAAAINYVQNPNYIYNPELANTPLPGSAISSFITTGVPINIDNAGVLTSSHLQEIRDAGIPISFINTDMGYLLTITDVTRTNPISVAIHLEPNAEAYKDIPAGVFLITPAAKGEFGMLFELTITNTDSLAGLVGFDVLKLYKVNDNGIKTYLRDVIFNADGTLTILIDSASQYFIEGTELPQGPQGPQGSQGLRGSSGGGWIGSGATGAPGRDGADGRDGSDGIDGRSGRDGVDGQNVTDGTPGGGSGSGSGTGGGSGGGTGGSGTGGSAGGGSGTGGNNNDNNWWSFQNDRNPSTNAAAGVTGLLAIAGAAAVMVLFKKRNINDDEDFID